MRTKVFYEPFISFLVTAGRLVFNMIHFCTCLIGGDLACAHCRSALRAVDMVLDGRRYVIDTKRFDIVAFTKDWPLVKLHCLGHGKPLESVYEVPLVLASPDRSFDFAARLEAARQAVSFTFSCPLDGCAKVYNNVGWLVRHISDDKHHKDGLLKFSQLPAVRAEPP